jgi:hypothetical protein
MKFPCNLKKDVEYITTVETEYKKIQERKKVHMNMKRSVYRRRKK